MAAVAAIICAIPVAGKFYIDLIRKIKSSRFPIYAVKAKEFLKDIYDRVFQQRIENRSKSDMGDYINSSHGVVANFNSPTTLPITSNGETKIYPKVTRIEIRPINPFFVNSGAFLSITYKREDYSNFDLLDSISNEESLRLRRQLYFLKLLENKRKQNDFV